EVEATGRLRSAGRAGHTAEVAARALTGSRRPSHRTPNKAPQRPRTRDASNAALEPPLPSTNDLAPPLRRRRDGIIVLDFTQGCKIKRLNDTRASWRNCAAIGRVPSSQFGTERRSGGLHRPNAGIRLRTFASHRKRHSRRFATAISI